MPLTLTVTEGVLPKGSEKTTFTELCEAMLRWHGLAGNPVITPNVVGSIHILPETETFSGLSQSAVAFIEWKMPSFTFTERAIQTGYIAEATDIVHRAAGGRLPKQQIWVNIVHAVDGGWGIAGEALSNAQLGARVAQGAS
jgi:phenylpyruvate tautomerase PptA (4-oxalocrotonate tautomerase family)